MKHNPIYLSYTDILTLPANVVLKLRFGNVLEKNLFKASY